MQELVSYIRDFVADPDGDRWSDTRIIYLINRAQNDLARRANLLYEEVELDITYEVDKKTGDKVGVKLELPDDTIRTIKVLEDGCAIPLVTESELLGNACAPKCQESCTGDVRYILADQYGRNTLGLVCRPFEDTEKREVPCPDTNTYVVDCNHCHTCDEDWWCGEQVRKYSCSDKFGCCDSLSCLLEVVKCYDDFKIPKKLTVIYNRMPKKVVDLNSKLDIHFAEQAIKFYVCGMLLRDDKDSNSRALGNEELQFYSTELKQLKKERSLNFYDGTNYNLAYRRGV